MKPIILLLSLVFTLTAKGQPPKAIITGDNEILLPGGKQLPHYDTIPCIMLVSDTAYYRDWKPLNSEWTQTMRGYCYHTDEIHVAYLDADKKPLHLFVWMSKNLK